MVIITLFLLILLSVFCCICLFFWWSKTQIRVSPSVGCLANYRKGTNKTAHVAVFSFPVGFLRKHIKPQRLTNEIDSWVNLTQSCGRTHAAKHHIGASLLKLLESLAMINMYRAPTERHITGSLSVCWPAQVFSFSSCLPYRRMCQPISIWAEALKMHTISCNTAKSTKCSKEINNPLTVWCMNYSISFFVLFCSPKGCILRVYELNISFCNREYI